MAEVEIYEAVQRLVSLASEYEKEIGGLNGSSFMVTHAAESFLKSFRKFSRKMKANVRAPLPVEVSFLVREFLNLVDMLENDLITVGSSFWSWLFFLSGIRERYYLSLNRIAMAVEEIHLKMSYLDTDNGGGEDEDEDGEEEEEKPNSHRFPVDMYSLKMNDDVVGFEEYVSELLSQLFVGFEKGKEDNTTTIAKQEEEGKGSGSVLVVSIVGIGGVGKTTLARMVFNMRVIREEFDCRIWINAFPSHKFRRGDVMVDILQQSSGSPMLVDSRSVDHNNNDHYYKEISNTVRSYLKEKRVLLVLDDVWEIGAWESIKDILPNGSRAILTTRQHGMINPDCGHLLSLDVLPKEKSWSLFCRNVQPLLTESLKPIGQAIVERCRGLPLSIVLMGRLLATKKPEPSTWEKFLKRMDLHLGESCGSLLDGLLSLSYEDLPCSLRACFTYCSLFPDDLQELPAKKLCRLWLAEGFVSSNLPSQEAALEAGVSELDQLIQRNLIHPVRVGPNGEVKTCRLLYPMRSFCNTLLEGLEVSVGLRRLCISCAGDKHVPSSSATSSSMLKLRGILQLHTSMVKLRSLQFVGLTLDCHQHHFSNLLSFGKFKLLRVLDFDHANLNVLPDNLDHLFNLRYLGLRDTRIESIKALPKLLQTLDIRRTNVTGLPQSIKHLIHLKYLYLCSSNMDKVVPLPRGLDPTKSLINLRKLTGVEITDSLAQALGKLTQLLKLSGGQVREEVSTTLCASLNELPFLTSLTLKCDHLERLNLDSLGNNKKLSKLRLGGRLMQLDNIALMKSLTCINIWDSMLDQDPLFMLQHLPSLVHLSLYNPYRGRLIRCEPEGFPKLKKLSILQFPYLEKWGKIEGGAMKSLEELRVGYCPKLYQLPDGLADLVSLQVIQVVEVPIQTKEIGKLKLKRIPESMLVHSPTKVYSLMKGEKQKGSSTGMVYSSMKGEKQQDFGEDIDDEAEIHKDGQFGMTKE